MAGAFSKGNPLTLIQGQLERITYTNEENGFTIARVKVQGRADLITIVGNMMGPTPGEMLEIEGEWATHPKYGEQFKIAKYRSKVPASIFGIEKYLGSGLIKGIGPVMAKRIVSRFGEKTLDIIEEDYETLNEVGGIGRKRIQMIKKAWDDQREIRQVMLFLQSHGVSSGYATKIFKRYGDRAIQVVRKNPYRLASDVLGIGFVIADRIAEKLGFSKDAPLRAEAGTLFVLHQLADEGHVFYPYELLIKKCADMLGTDEPVVVQAIGTIAFRKWIIIEDLNDLEGFKENHKAVYLAKYHLCENSIAERVKALLAVPKSIRDIDTEKAMAWVQARLTIRLAREQAQAIRCVAENKVMVITGGPGTGKTTIIQAILKIFSRLGVRIMLAAPTGRAAKKMSEATGFDAKTIHRLLEYSLQKGGFQKNDEKPLDVDLLVVDEASMIDTVLMHYLLKAVPMGATLLLVGDVNQLPSVGAGNVLKDIIDSGVVPVVTLNEIFRQARESLIIVNAHKINQGLLPLLQQEGGPGGGDFFFIEQEDPEEVLRIILELTSSRIPKRFGLSAVEDIQVLTPMHKGTVGAENLNRALQEGLNPGDDGLVRGDRAFRIKDKVMQVRNNYDKEVFNGDIGTITDIDTELRELTVSFDGKAVPYDFTDLDEMVLAYAISVHKSQGSEYPAVVIPVLTQHYMLLQRNLIYTAVTRGKRLVVLVGTRKALGIAVKNDKTEKRFTHLKERLRST